MRRRGARRVHSRMGFPDALAGAYSPVRRGRRIESKEARAARSRAARGPAAQLRSRLTMPPSVSR
ncbi:hypothetical protein FG484_10510 [Burkholderia pseudomallei]|nr:hypothetical protein [Burkholderia pseudomallei]NRD83130.1 hypothetical protein [Burkholderia pseudomallei]